MKFKHKEFDRAVKYFGSVYRISKLLGLTNSALYRWSKIPALRAYELEQLSDGYIKAKRLLDPKLFY
jgi:hypothetical protein